MKGLSKLLEFLKKEKKQGEIPEGFCPNCWGRQEYGGSFYEAIKNEKIDLNNVEEHYGWIQAYATRNLFGISLTKKGDKWECMKCNTKYKRTKN